LTRLTAQRSALAVALGQIANTCRPRAETQPVRLRTSTSRTSSRSSSAVTKRTSPASAPTPAPRSAAAPRGLRAQVGDAMQRDRGLAEPGLTRISKDRSGGSSTPERCASSSSTMILRESGRLRQRQLAQRQRATQARSCERPTRFGTLQTDLAIVDLG